MMLRVSKAADIVDGEVVATSNRALPGTLAAALTAIDRELSDPGPSWRISIIIGEGVSARQVVVELASVLSREEYETAHFGPVFLPTSPVSLTGMDLQFAIFRDRIFAVEPSPRNDGMKDEAALRMKRDVYTRDAEITSLKSYVSNVEAALEYRRGGAKREPIPDDVKLLVWARDGGACTRCGSKSELHFDHIIPVAKGGGSTSENIQLLCKPCNLRKSDKIAF
jgi:hypothetical protein